MFVVILGDRMPLHCTVFPDQGLALVAGDGNVTRQDIKGCLTLFKGQPVDRYGKLINLVDAQLVLSPVDLETIAYCLRRYCAKAFPGPIALSVHDSYNLDMAILLKQRVQPGKFRIFPDTGSALRWLQQTAVPGEAMRMAS
jgi:hypothetical protein